MSKKSKKTKKSKELDIQILSATDIEYYINSKWEATDDDFWAWFFEKCPYGQSVLLNTDGVYAEIPEQFKDYVYLIVDEFQDYADEDKDLEITNDF